MCEGWSLEIGIAFRGSVVRRDNRSEEPASEQELLALLRPCQDDALKIWPVNKMVGNVKNNGPQLILPVMSNAVPA
jgi:hypothetical protein